MQRKARLILHLVAMVNRSEYDQAADHAAIAERLKYRKAQSLIPR